MAVFNSTDLLSGNVPKSNWQYPGLCVCVSMAVCVS